MNIKLSHFFSIFATPVEKIANIDVSPVNSLRQKAQEFLDLDLLSIYVKMITKGYEPSMEQQNQLEDKIKKEIIQYGGTPQSIIDLLKEGLEINQNLFNMFILEAGALNYYTPESENNSENQLYLWGRIVPLFDNKDYTDNLLNTWKNEILNISENSKKIIKQHIKEENFQNLEYNLFKNMTMVYSFNNVLELMFKNTPSHEYLAIRNEFKELQDNFSFPIKTIHYSKTYDKKKFKTTHDLEKTQNRWDNLLGNVIDKMDKSFDKFYANDINNILEETQKVFVNNNLDKLTKEKTFSTLQFNSINELPENVKNLIHQIKEKYSTVLNDYALINEMERHDLQDLVIDKLPNTINRYLSMNEEYRQTMKTAQGKTAQDLLIESLENIYEHLYQLELTTNENKLKDLSVVARYTKSKM